MGGNLIQSKFGFPEKRLSAEQYKNVVQDILDKLREFCTDHGFSGNYQAIQAYRNKESFGDADILHSLECDLTVFAKAVADKGLYSQNGGVISFPYGGFQIDLIKTKEEDYLAAYSYFSYNDLGNFIGRIAHKMGLSYGHDGLHYILRTELFGSGKENSHIIAKIPLAKHPAFILPFLGFDITRYEKGFDSIEEIFQFVADSKYFNPDIYLLDNVNHKSRIRDRKRKSYNGLLEWIRTNNPQSKHEFTKDKSEYLRMALDEFPALENDLLAAHQSYAIREAIKRKLNGDIVREICGELDGKEIGRIISFIKEKYGNQLLFLSAGYIRNLFSTAAICN